MNDVMPGSAEDFGSWKKTVNWDLNSERVSWDSSLQEGSRFLVLPRRDHLGSTKCAARLLSQWVESWRCTKSQHRKKLCLSLLMSKNLKLKKVIKSFVPETKRVVRVSRIFRNSLWTFCVYFTCSYLGRIILDFYITKEVALKVLKHS